MSETARLSAEEALARRMGEARDRAQPNLRPRPAASLIIAEAGPAPRILMGRRHPGHRFMPDRFVFPGGSLARGDARAHHAGAFDETTQRRLAAAVPQGARHFGERLALCALRETYEETGLLLGRRGAWTAPAPSGWEDFARRGVVPDLTGLRFIARAITPPRRPKRFDTRFFLTDAAAVAERVEGLVGPDSELIELAWVTAAEAERLPMPEITRVVLQEALAAILDPQRPVPCWREHRGRMLRETLG